MINPRPQKNIILEHSMKKLILGAFILLFLTSCSQAILSTTKSTSTPELTPTPEPTSTPMSIYDIDLRKVLVPAWEMPDGMYATKIIYPFYKAGDEKKNPSLNSISQQLETDDGILGNVLIRLYESKIDAEALYKDYLKYESNPWYPGEKNGYYKGGYIFLRCATTAYITVVVNPTNEQNTAIKEYASKLDGKIKKIICPSSLYAK